MNITMRLKGADRAHVVSERHIFNLWVGDTRLDGEVSELTFVYPNGECLKVDTGVDGKVRLSSGAGEVYCARSASPIGNSGSIINFGGNILDGYLILLDKDNVSLEHVVSIEDGVTRSKLGWLDGLGLEEFMVTIQKAGCTLV